MDLLIGKRAAAWMDWDIARLMAFFGHPLTYVESEAWDQYIMTLYEFSFIWKKLGHFPAILL